MVNPEIFEAIMLICFGVAWPLSICKMLKSRQSHGKSIAFLSVILLGYISGLLFEYFGARNAVTFLYLLNTIMVVIDIALTVKYRQPAR